MIRILACFSVAFAMALYGLDRLCAWTVDSSTAVHAIVSTPEFAVVAVIGGVVVALAPVVAVALMIAVHTTPKAGEGE